MATIARTRLLSPGGASVLARDGGHTKTWRGFFDEIARELSRRRVITEPNVDLPSIAAGGFTQVTLTIPGKGITRDMFASASYESLVSDVVMTASVTGVDEVTVWFENRSASPVDMAPGTLRVRLEVP